MLYPSSRRPNSIFRIISSMIICPLIRGIGCTVPLCAIRMSPLSARHGYPVPASALAWRFRVDTERNFRRYTRNCVSAIVYPPPSPEMWEISHCWRFVAVGRLRGRG